MNNVDLPKLSNEENNNNDGFKEMIKYVTNKNGKELFYLILRLLLIVGIIIIFKFPFDLFRDVGINILTLLGITITNMVLNIWTSIINIIYGIAAIYAFIKIIKIRFKNINNDKKVIKNN
jgi:hypothetical protein